jgi:DNA-binding PadR family transcriptional regulator
MSCPISLRRTVWVSLDLAILGFLAERPRSGYDLKTRCFGGAIGAFWTADQAQIYRTLERLKESKLVTATRRRQASRPDRRIFEITPAGREVLAEKLGSPAPLLPLRDPFLVQLYFSAGLSDDAVLGVLTARRNEHQQRLEGLRNQAASLARAQGLASRDAVLKQTAFDGAIAQQRALVDWLDECIDAVSEGTLPGSETGTGQRHLFGT